MGPTLRRRLRRTLVVLGGLLLLVEVIYLMAGNYYVNSSRLLALINRKPEKFSIRWGAGWTVVPGIVHLHGVEMGGRSKKVEWYAKLDSVSAWTRLLPLSERTVRLRHVWASGIDYRQKRRQDVGLPVEAPAAELPSMPDVGLEPPSDRPAGPKKPPGKPWTILADEIDVEVEQLWLGRYRVSGPMDVETSMKLVVRGPLEFPGIRVAMEKGELTAGEGSIFGGLGLDVDTSLGPFVPKGIKGADVVRTMKGRFQVRAESASLFFLEAYFRKAPWLRFNGRSAVAADLRLDGGVLQPGSTLESKPEAMDVDILDRKLTGKGVVSLRVEESGTGPLSRAVVELHEFALSVPDQQEPYATGQGFKVTAQSGALDVTSAFTTLDVVADLTEAVVPDLAYFNRYVPPRSGIVLRGGTGKLSYHVEANQEEGSAHGWIELSAADMAMLIDTYEMKGDVKIHTALKDVRPREGWFDASGTRIDAKSDKFPWTATIVLPKAQVRFGQPLQMAADAEIRMTDTTPLVALFDAKKDVSRIVEKLMTIQDVQGKAACAIGDRGTEIQGLEIHGEDFVALADLAFRENAKDGILYLKLGVFSVGVALEKGKKDLDLVRARTWFEKARAKRKPR